MVESPEVESYDQCLPISCPLGSHPHQGFNNTKRFSLEHDFHEKDALFIYDPVHMKWDYI